VVPAPQQECYMLNSSHWLKFFTDSYCRLKTYRGGLIEHLWPVSLKTKSSTISEKVTKRTRGYHSCDEGSTGKLIL
jgi:hypothetical protein